MKKQLTASKPNRAGFKFLVKKKVWIATRPENLIYSGNVVNGAGETIIKGVSFELPKNLFPNQLRFSMTEFELSGELILIDDNTGTGYADKITYPENARPDITEL